MTNCGMSQLHKIAHSGNSLIQTEFIERPEGGEV
jgi:hypothetical protein